MSNAYECIMARAVARVAHSGQTDKAGRPYIEHPERVAASVPIDCAPAALLHDVVEDTPLTIPDLVAAGFNDATIAAVDALTRRTDEPYKAYIARCAANRIARIVKLADIADNRNPERVAEAKARGARVAGLLKRYDEAERVLEGVTP
jgi:(p)ppGpp synthase/HD superfamily hydrolase